jgi:transcriptional regulator with XRE-family HTH domain
MKWNTDFGCALAMAFLLRRKKVGIHQRDLASKMSEKLKLDIKQEQISRWESAKTTMPAAIIEVWAEALDTNLINIINNVNILKELD